jgi:hypothetical protein
MSGGTATAGQSAMREAMVGEFERRLAAVGGRLWRAHDPVALPAVVAQAARALVGRTERPGEVLGWELVGWPGFGWADAFQPPDWVYHGIAWGMAGLTVSGLPADAQAIRRLAATGDLGVTGCAWGVVETGSLALYQERDSGLWPSLLPPAHLVVLHERQLLPTLAEGLRVLGDRLKPTTNHPTSMRPSMVKIVTGPSSTADIEGQLVVGVHGPGRLGVVLAGEAVPFVGGPGPT